MEIGDTDTGLCDTMSAMAMTLRLNDDDEAALAKLQASGGGSKQEAVRRAIREEARRVGRRDEIASVVDRFKDDYGDVVERLAAT